MSIQFKKFKITQKHINIALSILFAVCFVKFNYEVYDRHYPHVEGVVVSHTKPGKYDPEHTDIVIEFPELKVSYTYYNLPFYSIGSTYYESKADLYTIRGKLDNFLFICFVLQVVFLLILMPFLCIEAHEWYRNLEKK